jgi:hypothetical protein
MRVSATVTLQSIFATFIVAIMVCGCTAQPGMISAQSAEAASPVTDGAIPNRPGFLGAFFRPEGTPPFGVFSVYSKQEPPDPVPQTSTTLFGPHGYCDEVAPNGLSISSGYLVDKAKLANIVDLGVTWTRTTPASFFDDKSHIEGAGHYDFVDFDSSQCALARHNIVPIIAIEAGPVQYNQFPDQFSPKQQPIYKTPADFAQWCSVVVTHERRTFTAVHRYSLPGNEVNTNQDTFTGGAPQIASYSEACYRAIKSADPQAFVYAFELNMDSKADAAGFVQRMYDAGCKPKNCYDGLSMHLSLRYPIPPLDTPCFPNPGGDYSMQCIEDVRAATHAPIHVIIGETGYFIPSTVRDENMKAAAVIAAFRAFASNKFVDGVNYANIDECDLYPNGYFVGGCLVDSIGTRLPAYFALQKLALHSFK